MSNRTNYSEQYEYEFKSGAKPDLDRASLILDDVATELYRGFLTDPNNDMEQSELVEVVSMLGMVKNLGDRITRLNQTVKRRRAGREPRPPTAYEGWVPE